MVGNTERGFTVIEVMLFLAITGGLFAALMVGVNTGVTQQRYLDSVRSYKSLLQQQYSEVLNTRNVVDSSYKCEGDKSVSKDISATRDTRGTSSCVILGRAVQIVAGSEGRTIKTSSVTGYDNVNSQDNASDELTVLNSYLPRLSVFDSVTQDVDWQSNLTSTTTVDGKHPAATTVILILRSPTTGVIRLFTSQTPLNGDTVDLRSMITAANSSSTGLIQNCVDGSSGFLPKQIVSINPRISSPDAVTTDGGQNSECQS